VKYAIVERARRTIREKIYKFFTYKNTYRYLEVLPKFVKAYNNTVHTATGMAPSKVTDSDILAIWKRMREKYAYPQRSKISRRSACYNQQRKDEVCQSFGTKLYHGDF
jgi:hypothetical protein